MLDFTVFNPPSVLVPRMKACVREANRCFYTAPPILGRETCFQARAAKHRGKKPVRVQGRRESCTPLRFFRVSRGLRFVFAPAHQPHFPAMLSRCVAVTPARRVSQWCPEKKILLVSGLNGVLCSLRNHVCYKLGLLLLSAGSCVQTNVARPGAASTRHSAPPRSPTQPSRLRRPTNLIP